MALTVAELADEIRGLLKAHTPADCADELCAAVGKALTDDEFVAANLPDRAEGEDPREVLYEDPDLGFCICGHVYGGNAVGEPHDHGSSWAIYGQAAGTTEMTDWRIVEPGGGDKPILVEPEKTYVLRPGDAHFYDVHRVHSPNRTEPTRLIRIEGANLDHVRRSNIAKAAA